MQFRASLLKRSGGGPQPNVGTPLKSSRGRKRALSGNKGEFFQFGPDNCAPYVSGSILGCNAGDIFLPLSPLRWIPVRIWNRGIANLSRE